MGFSSVRRCFGMLGAVATATVLAGPAWSAPGDEYRARYQVYAMVPQSSLFGPGSIVKGWLEPKSSVLRMDGAICSYAFDAAKAETGTLPGIEVKSDRDHSLDVTATVKTIVEGGVKANYIRKVSLNIKNAKIYEFDNSVLREIREELVKRDACRKELIAERDRMDEVSPADRRKGLYFLLWQTRRAVRGDMEYSFEFNRGVSPSAKVDVVKDVAVKLNANISGADQTKISGSSVWIGIWPYYYHLWNDELAALESAKGVPQVAAAATGKAKAAASSPKRDRLAEDLRNAASDTAKRDAAVTQVKTKAKAVDQTLGIARK